MILFWLGALALVAAALAFLLPPLLATRRPEAPAPREDTALYRSRLAALEEQHRLGALGDEEFAQARDELGRALLEESAAAGTRAAAARPRPWLAVAVGIGVPLLAVGLYQRLGTPAAVNPPPAPIAADDAAVEEMVARLAARMRESPGDSQGWLLLGRSYMVMERYGDAAEAYAAAHRLLGDSPDLLADLAEAEGLADGTNFLGRPSEHLETALGLDPEHPKALWLGAFAAMQRGEPALAVSRWEALLARQAPDSEASEILRGLIAGAGTAAGGAPAEPADTAAAGLTVDVVIADRLLAGLDGSEALFVFARPAETGAGGPPLAVVRRSVRDLPLTVTLDDTMAMVPGRRLSDHSRVVVGARISLRGEPVAASGDLQGFSPPVASPGAASVAITERIP